MFGIKPDFPSHNTYAQAREYFNSTEVPKYKRWTDTALDGSRPMGKDSSSALKPHMSVRLGDNEELIYRLYDTDLVTHHPDGRITLEPYTTLGTNLFVNRLLPSGLYVDYKDDYRLVWVHVERGGRMWDGHAHGYQIGTSHALTVERTPDADGLWQVTDEFKPGKIVYPVVDRKAARKVLKDYNYSDFAAFILAMGAISGGAQREDVLWWDRLWWDRRKPYQPIDMPPRGAVINALQGGIDDWVAFSKEHRAVICTHTSTFLRHVRNMLYRHEYATKDVTLDYIESYKQLTYIKQQRKIFA